jgi:hypothetical protein
LRRLQVCVHCGSGEYAGAPKRPDIGRMAWQWAKLGRVAIGGLLHVGTHIQRSQNTRAIGPLLSLNRPGAFGRWKGKLNRGALYPFRHVSKAGLRPVRAEKAKPRTG